MGLRILVICWTPALRPLCTISMAALMVCSVVEMLATQRAQSSAVFCGQWAMAVSAMATKGFHVEHFCQRALPSVAPIWQLHAACTSRGAHLSHIMLHTCSKMSNYSGFGSLHLL